MKRVGRWRTRTSASLAVFAAMLNMTACGSQPTYQNSVVIPRPSTDHENVIEDPVEQRFVLYDEERKTAVSWTNVPNEFVYHFATPSDVYTIGNSLTNHFSIVRLVNGRVQTLYVLPDQAHEAVFPLATNGRMMFFLLVHYRDDGTEVWRHIVQWDAHSRVLHAFQYVDGAIEQGALVGTDLYYTVIRPDQSVWLYRVNATRLDARPTLVSTRWAEGPLLSCEGRLLLMKDHRLIFGSHSWPVRAVNLVTPNGILVQFDEDENSLTTRADVYELRDGRRLGGATNVEGFQWIQNGIRLACTGHSETVFWSETDGTGEMHG